MSGWEVFLILLGAWGGVVITSFGLAIVSVGKRADQFDCRHERCPGWRGPDKPAHWAAPMLPPDEV